MQKKSVDDATQRVDKIDGRNVENILFSHI